MNYLKKALSIKQTVNTKLAKDLDELNISQNSLQHQKYKRIVNLTCSQIVSMLNNNQVTSVELVKLFAYRSATIGKQLEAITQNNFKKALELAQKCDFIRKNKGLKNQTFGNTEKQALPPLFGVPISIKDAFMMKGFASTIGLVERYSQKADTDGEIIQVLENSGLIPFIRSNVPPLLSTYSSGNKLWGVTKNPWDKSRTAGGSSGGQAALIASKCSPLGIGSDIGGSLRNPAEFCGICTIKPNSQRLTVGGHASFAPSIDSQTNIQCAIGPLARSVEDLALFMKTVCDQKYYTANLKDPYKKLLQFDFQTYLSYSNNSKPLKIGYFKSLDICPASQASQQAVQIAINVLESKGHKLQQIKIPNSGQYVKLLMTQVFVQGLKGHLEVFNNQPLTKDYQMLQRINKMPRWLKWIALKVLLQSTQILFKTKPRLELILKNSHQLSTYQYLAATTKLQNFKRQFYQMWIEKDLDFIICPGFHCQAIKIQQQHPLGVYPAVYNYMWNTLDYPVGSLPINLSKEQDVSNYDCKYNDSFSEKIKESQKNAVNLPVGIQVVGLPFEEEKVLGLMKAIEKQVKFSENHPYPF